MTTGTPAPRLELSSLVDVAFLLLTYFILTSTLDPREADLGLSMRPPPIISPPENEVFPEMTKVAITADGFVWCDEVLMETDPDHRDLPQLLVRLREVRTANLMIREGSSHVVSVSAADAVPGQRLVDVMNCLAKAGIGEVMLEGFVD